jgi:hypothetical protein
MLRNLLTTVLLAAWLAAPAGAAAQETKAPTPAPDRPEKTAPPRTGLPVNVRLELTITDQSGPGAASKRTVTMLLADNKRGSIRSAGTVRMGEEGRFPVELNVDAHPEILSPGRGQDELIQLALAVQYQPKPGTDNAGSGEGRAGLNEQLSVLLQPGKPMLISQAADPTSDRRITVEVTATILR